MSAGWQVAGLRASRDKLLLELDDQAAEAQRLALENGALQQARAPACPRLQDSHGPHAAPQTFLGTEGGAARAMLPH